MFTAIIVVILGGSVIVMMRMMMTVIAIYGRAAPAKTLLLMHNEMD